MGHLMEQLEAAVENLVLHEGGGGSSKRSSYVETTAPRYPPPNGYPSNGYSGGPQGPGYAPRPSASAPGYAPTSTYPSNGAPYPAPGPYLSDTAYSTRPGPYPRDSGYVSYSSEYPAGGYDPTYTADRDRYADDRDHDRDRYENGKYGENQYEENRYDGDRYDRERYDRDRYGGEREGGDKSRYDDERGRYDRDRPYEDDRYRYGDRDRNNADRDRYDTERGRYDTDRDRYDTERDRYDTHRDQYDGDRYNNGSSGSFERNRYDNIYTDNTGSSSYQPYAGRGLMRLAHNQHVRRHRSFYSAYSRAAHRYGFEAGKYAGFCKRDGVVVKVRGLYDKDADHEVAATSIQNGGTEYVVPVTIGTPGVTVNLDFDTGSSDLWIWSSELVGISQYSKHTIYDPRSSSTARHDRGRTWNISYGDGSSASGDVFIDAVTVAGVTIPDQAVECASHLSEAFLKDGGNDGLLGLAWPRINTVQPRRVKTPMESMIEQGLIEQPLFTVKLGHKGEPSFYSFGWVDPNVTSHRMHWAQVDNSQGFWQVHSTAYILNGETYNREGNTAILDTGTTLMLLDDDVVEAIYCSIDGAAYDESHGGWKYPSDARIPDISFAVGEHYYRLNADDFGFGDAGDGYTLGGIQSRGDMDFDIFGDVFLKSVYVAFNQGEQTVGVAQRDD